MQKQLNQLIEFHTKFNVPFRTEFEAMLPEEVILMRGRLMWEELDEWVAAAGQVDPITNRAKELADILYTVFGTIITEGLQDQIERVFDAVHASNLTKSLDSRREDGKILKGQNYKAPDLNFLL